MCVHIYYGQQHEKKLAPPDLYVKAILKAQPHDNCVRALSAMLSHILKPNIESCVVTRHLEQISNSNATVLRQEPGVRYSFISEIPKYQRLGMKREDFTRQLQFLETKSKDKSGRQCSHDKLFSRGEGRAEVICWCWFCWSYHVWVANMPWVKSKVSFGKDIHVVSNFWRLIQ